MVTRLNQNERPSVNNSASLSYFLNHKVCVALTAYNDQEAIFQSVKQFISNRNVVEVIVVDNNSHDKTARQAKNAGARVVHEKKQGYGYACIRGLMEALTNTNSDVVVLAEGDMTFCAKDINKLLCYIDEVDMVVGSRTHMVLVDSESQLDWFLLWGNVFLAKLMQLKFINGKFLGRVRLTDAGCTMKAIKKEALIKIANKFSVGGDYFSPHMIMVALRNGLSVIEVPINFRRRVGISKGACGSKRRACKIGLGMLWHILTF